MKIAIWYNLPSGGAKRSLYDQVVGLQRRGHEVHLWHPPLRQAGYLELGKIAPDREIPLEDHARRHWFKPRQMYLNITAVDRFAEAADRHAAACAREIEAGGFDLLFSNSDEWFHAPHIGRHLRLPKALYLHEPNRPFYEATPRLRWLLPPKREWPASRLGRMRFLMRSLISIRDAQVMASEEIENATHFDRILVNSRYSRESVLRTYGQEAHVCYLGIDPGVFENRGLNREPFAISVGTLTPSKNAEFLIRALGTMPVGLRPRFLWVCNSEDGAYRETMVKLAEELGVDFQPKTMVSDAELIDLLNRTSAFLYAPRLEPFGLAPLEANACGAPVVAVAEGGMRETIEDGGNGLLADAEPEAFGVQVAKLLGDAALARRIGATGSELVRTKWSPEAAMDRLEHHLEATIRAAKRRG